MKVSRLQQDINIGCHPIFYIKATMITRKTRRVANDHTMDSPESIIYASVVLRESVRVDLLIDTFNNVDIFSSGVLNGYLNNPHQQKAWFRSRTKFGQYKGRVIVLINTLHKISSSTASWRSMISKMMINLGFSPYRTDPDFQINAVNKLQVLKCWEYVRIHDENLLVISHQSYLVMNFFDKAYTLKSDPKTGNKCDKPSTYLDANLDKFQIPDIGETCWLISGDSYTCEAIKTVY